MRINPDECFDLKRGAKVQPGPAFVSREVIGQTWGGSEEELNSLENVKDITRLVLFDTWVRNCDRHPPDLSVRKPNYANVYLADSHKKGKSRLIAIDHTHCFDCGNDFSVKLSSIEKVKEDRTYGMFPPFAPRIDLAEIEWCKADFRQLPRAEVEGVVDRIP